MNCLLWIWNCATRLAALFLATLNDEEITAKRFGSRVLQSILSHSMGSYECSVTTQLFGISRSLESTNLFVISGVLFTVLRVAWSVCPYSYIVRIINLLKNFNSRIITKLSNCVPIGSAWQKCQFRLCLYLFTYLIILLDRNDYCVIYRGAIFRVSFGLECLFWSEA